LRKSLGLLDEAVKAGGPFFLTVAPIGPHANMHFRDPEAACLSGLAAAEAVIAAFSQPQPQVKYQNAFPGAKVPRTPNFNPNVVSSFYRRPFIRA
jgi:N-acetylglucosamine-6-sulfatase